MISETEHKELVDQLSLAYEKIISLMRANAYTWTNDADRIEKWLNNNPELKSIKETIKKLPQTS